MNFSFIFESKALPYIILFFKQNTANYLRLSLVGSKMCIRDSPPFELITPRAPTGPERIEDDMRRDTACPLYTYEAADDSLRVDLYSR